MHYVCMSVIANPSQALVSAPISIAVTQLDTPLRFSPAIQAVINRCGPKPVIGGRYAAWVHGLLPQPGSLIVFQTQRRALPISAHPSVQIRHDHLDRRYRARGQLICMLDAAADMVAFAHTPAEAAEVARRFLTQGGDASALRAAIALRPARFHEKSMLEALTACETPAPQGASQHSHEGAMLEALTEAETTQEDKA